jgi:hypothetical protein
MIDYDVVVVGAGVNGTGAGVALASGLKAGKLISN